MVMGFFEAFMSNKERVVTGFSLLGILLVVGLIDNLFVMWLFLGVVYIIAFMEGQFFSLKGGFAIAKPGCHPAAAGMDRRGAC